MYLAFLDRRRNWVIRVTYISGAVRFYGPIRYKREAEAFLGSRLVDNTYTGQRGRLIIAADVRRRRRVRLDGSADDLVGVRFVQP